VDLFAEQRGLMFADPTRHLRGGPGAGRNLLPMNAEEDPGCRAGGHHSCPAPGHRASGRARRPPRAIRERTLDDIDLPGRRITLAGHRQPLGDLTRNALLAWLEYRRATWPDTTSRHILVSRISALGTRPLSAGYPGKHQPRGVCPGHIRAAEKVAAVP
jgi:hypothetical protein